MNLNTQIYTAGACLMNTGRSHGDLKCKTRGIEVWVSDDELAKKLGADCLGNVIVPGRLIYEYDEEDEKFYAVSPLCDLIDNRRDLWHRCDPEVQIVAKAERILFDGIAHGKFPIPAKSISLEYAKELVAL